MLVPRVVDESGRVEIRVREPEEEVVPEEIIIARKEGFDKI